MSDITLGSRVHFETSATRVPQDGTVLNFSGPHLRPVGVLFDGEDRIDYLRFDQLTLLSEPERSIDALLAEFRQKVADLTAAAEKAETRRSDLEEAVRGIVPELNDLFSLDHSLQTTSVIVTVKTLVDEALKTQEG